MDALTSPGGEVRNLRGVYCTASPAPGLTPSDADALEAFFWWPFVDERDEVVPDYSDVQ